MRLLGSVLAAASVLFCSGTSFALFDVEALVGKRWYKFENTGGETDNVASQEIDLAVHLDPIPVIPVGFGVGVIAGDLRTEDFYGAGVTEAKVLEVDLEVKAWVPMVPIVTPFVKVKVPVSAKAAIKGKNSAGEEYGIVQKLTGYHVNAGVLYPIIPLIKLTFEVGKGMQKAEIEEYKVASVKQPTTGSKKENVNSDTVMLGVQVGF